MSTLTKEQISALYGELLQVLVPEVLARKSSDEFLVELEDYIKRYAQAHEFNLTEDEIKRVSIEIKYDFVGFGPLEYLLEDDEISEIMVNGPDKVFVEKKGKIQLSEVTFRNNAHVLNIAQRIANTINRRIDDSRPLLNARLPDGSRVNAVLSPISLDGVSLSIRKFTKELLGLDFLIEKGAVTPKMAKFLKICSKCRINTLVAGGTGSGKTTMLNILSSMIDPTERIVTIEDSAELQLKVPNLVRLEAREANAEGKGAITIYDLVINSLRMRPERIIIGEVRGSEAFEMLKVMNTGHDGSMSTVHCNTAKESLLRLENMVSSSNPGIPFLTVRWQIASALDLVVFVKRLHDGSRRCTEILDVQSLQGNEIQTKHFFNFKVKGVDENDKVIGDYETSYFEPSFMEKIKLYGLEKEFRECLSEDS